jgi:hypothetical protein
MLAAHFARHHRSLCTTSIAITVAVERELREAFHWPLVLLVFTHLRARGENPVDLFKKGHLLVC